MWQRLDACCEKLRLAHLRVNCLLLKALCQMLTVILVYQFRRLIRQTVYRLNDLFKNDLDFLVEASGERGSPFSRCRNSGRIQSARRSRFFGRRTNLGATYGQLLYIELDMIFIVN